MPDKAKRVLLALDAPRQEDLWHAALLSQECEVESIPRGVSLASFGAGRAPRSRPADLLLVDLCELAAEALTLGRFSAELAAAQPRLKLAATLSERFEVAAAERRWAKRQGAIDLFPRLSAAALMRARSAAFASVLSELGLTVDGVKLAQALRAIGASAEDGVVADPAALSALGVDLEDLAEEMRGPEGVECRKRRYHLRAYPDCFVGSDAVAWITRACGVSRETALQAGQELLARGVFYHVAKEQPFRDGLFFYRFTQRSRALDAIDLDELMERMRSPEGVPIQDRTYRRKSYARCFVGSEAVRWFMHACALTREDATSLGQRLMDLRLIHHVVDEHEFVDENFFYRFYVDEAR
jgi:Domain found in Dishevelled, Egl-10, and Pleckstrin (DEP)